MARRIVGLGVAVLLLAAAGVASPAWAQKKGKQAEVVDIQALCAKNYQTGMEFLRNQRFIDAKEMFTAVVEVCPEHVDARQALGRVALNLRDYPLAIESYEKAREQRPDDLDILELLAYSYSSSARIEDAERLYREVLELDPQRSAALQNLAFILGNQKKGPESIMLDMQSLALATEGETAEFPEALGRKFLDAKLYHQAALIYGRLVEENPADLSSARILAYFYYRIGHHERAVQMYEELLRQEPESPTALFEHKLTADALRKLKRTTEAVRHMEYVMEREPDVMNNYYSLAGIHKDAGAFDRAMAIADRGLARNSSWGCMWYIKGDILDARADRAAEAKDYDAAIQLYTEAKAAFARAANDPQCGGNVPLQLDRHDKLVDRVQKLREKEAAER